MSTSIEKINDTDLVYVASDVAIEPLIDNWYAWAHLVSPATAAMNIKNRHLSIIESYIQNPMIHAAAVKNPKMLGGPFIDYGGKRVEEVKELKEQTEIACKELLDFGEQLDQLNALLEKEANGYSLEPLYPKVPDSLRGLVELYYDLNNNPSYRFIEPLLYRTQYYKEELQAINLFKVHDDDSRSFVLSTPSLPAPDVLRLNIPLKSKKIDALFETANSPKPYGELKALFGINAEQEALFKSLFTKKEPKSYEKYEKQGVLTRYFGHACILVETKNTSILVDPVVSYGYESDLSRFTYENLPEVIDFVLITHNHQDHVLFETLLRIRHKVKNIVVPKSNGGGLQDPNLKLMFQKLGFESVIEIGEMETLEFTDCSISGIPFLGEHSDLDVRSKICHMVQFKDNFKMIFAADSCNIEPRLYERVKEVYGKVDIVFLGMECDGAPLSWLYGPIMPKKLERDKDQTRRLAGSDFQESKALIDIFEPTTVFVYAMGMEPWLKYISSIKYTEESKPIIESNKTIAYCIEKGIDAERLFGEKIIEYGEAVVLPV